MRSPLRTLAGIVRPTNAAPVPYVGRSRTLGQAFGSRNDAESQMRAMESVGTLFAIVDRLATSVAEVEWKLYRKAKSGNDEDRVEVTSHLALDIWSKPNPWMPRQEFVEVVQQHLDLTGEAWWVVARNPRMRSIPLELWPVRPDRMEPIPSREDFITGYVYRSPDGEVVPLQVDEVIMLRRPRPLDPYRGISPVGTILPDIDASRYSAEWNRNFFINSALPSGVIEAPNNLGDTEFNELRDRWEEQHRGVAAAHRVAILEGGLKWVDRRFTQRDMEFVELRSASREVIREAYAIHGHTLGLSESVNRANAEAADVSFARWQIKPRLGRIKQALNHDFLPLFGGTAEGLEWDFENPVPEDAEARDRERTSKATAAKLYREAGYTGDSVREALELPDALVWEAPPDPPAAPVAPAPAAAPPVSPEALLRRLRAAADDGSRVEQLVAAAMAAIRSAFEHALETLLAAWDTISRAWRRELVDQVRAAIDDGDLAALADLEVDAADARERLGAAMLALAEAAAQGVADEAAAQGVSVDAVTPDPEALTGPAAVVVRVLADGLASSAASEALRLASPDATPGEVANAVDEHLRGLSDRPLRDQLGGALHTAQTSGRMATLEAAPPALWIASERNDDAACQPCKDVDDTRYDTLTRARAAYPTGGYRECKGRTRCRGTIVPIWEGQ